MLATLTLMSALTLPAADAGELQLTNARVTYGRLGPTRKDTKFLPGDVYFVTFDIEGLQFKDGNAKYSMKMELFDPKGTSKYKSLEQPQEVFAIQGGGRLTSDAHAVIPTDAAPGEYRMELAVTDLNTKKQATMTRKYEVAEKAFGIVRVTCAYDLGGVNGPVFPSPGLGVVGQVLFQHFAVTGFDRDPKTKQPNLELQLRMLDENGKPTLEKAHKQPFPTGEDAAVPETFTVVPLWFPLALTKPGKYTVELTATDTLTKKTATVTYPLVVQEPPK
jgi:PKD repeat protein